MASEREYQAKDGKHLITPAELLERLPEGIRRRVEQVGMPSEGTGSHLIQNEYARIAVEKRKEVKA